MTLNRTTLFKDLLNLALPQYAAANICSQFFQLLHTAFFFFFFFKYPGFIEVSRVWAIYTHVLGLILFVVPLFPPKLLIALPSPTSAFQHLKPEKFLLSAP